MISRVAEHCFWLHRYLERAEHTARLLRVTRTYLLDMELPELERWHSALVVSGEHQRFPELVNTAASDNGEAIQAFLTWDERCGAGMKPSVKRARENARTIREVISLEMWESINAFWHFFSRGAGRKLYSSDRDAFYAKVKAMAALVHGTCHSTMSHSEPFDFMRLGMLLERAGQTARMMDVKHHILGPTQPDAEAPVESALESAQWVALLRSCSAEHSFFRRHPLRFTAEDVVGFLLLEETFPQSVAYCLSRTNNFLRRIESTTGRPGLGSAKRARALTDELLARSATDILEAGLHEELTRMIDTIAGICDQIHADYFDPSLGRPTPGRENLQAKA